MHQWSGWSPGLQGPLAGQHLGLSSVLYPSSRRYSKATPELGARELQVRCSLRNPGTGTHITDLSGRGDEN